MATLSERARAGLDHFVMQAAQTSLAGGEGCAVLPADCAEATQSEAVMLTVSSYTFRVLLFMYFDDRPAMRQYFGALSGQGVEEMAGERFRDVVMERGNLLCGAVNRDLAAFFPHIGMSTPCILKRSAVEQVASVKPSFTRCYKADTTAGVPLYVAIAVCAKGEFDFPFESHVAKAQADAAGELEMF